MLHILDYWSNNKLLVLMSYCHCSLLLLLISKNIFHTKFLKLTLKLNKIKNNWCQRLES